MAHSVFVTGGTGLVGTAVVRELVHSTDTRTQLQWRVVALARSEAAAAQLVAAGVAEVVRGDVGDTALLQRVAARADIEAVVHLAFELSGDLQVMKRSTERESAAISAFIAALRGTHKPLLLASGTSVAQPGHELLETDVPRDPARGARELLALPLAARAGVCVHVIRLPLVYADGADGFPPVLTRCARAAHALLVPAELLLPPPRQQDVPTAAPAASCAATAAAAAAAATAAAAGPHTPVVHRDDVARLYRRVLEHAFASATASASTTATVTATAAANSSHSSSSGGGSSSSSSSGCVGGAVWHAVAEHVPLSALARVLAQRLGVPLKAAASADELRAQYGFFAAFFSADLRASTAHTYAALGWRPLQPSLLAELRSDRARDT